MNNIFMLPFFTKMVLPFMFVFVVVFAILQKSKILGEGKMQIDAIVALVVGLLLIGVPAPRNIIIGIMPWMAVGLAVILVFLILYGFVAGDLTNMPSWMKIIFGILAAIFTMGVVLHITDMGAIVSNWVFGSGSGAIWINILMFILIVGAVVVAIFGGKKKS